MAEPQRDTLAQPLSFLFPDLTRIWWKSTFTEHKIDQNEQQALRGHLSGTDSRFSLASSYLCTIQPPTSRP